MSKSIQTDEILPLAKAIPLSLQHLMAMFGATVLVPLLTGLDPGVGLMTSGIGTILYLICVRNKIPSYLGSSFAFIAPLIAVGGGPGGDNIPAALGGLVVAGFVYMVVAFVIKAVGTAWLDRLLPPALIGSVVVVIGLGSVGGGREDVPVSRSPTRRKPVDMKYLAVAGITLASAIVFSSFFKGFLKTIPILMGIIVGYLVSIPLGLVSFARYPGGGLDRAAQAHVPGIPARCHPDHRAGRLRGHHRAHRPPLVINEITGKDFTPILPESLFGDGLATAISGAIGGTPSTTYAENIGVMAVTKVYATQLFWYAGAFAIIIGGFVPKFGAAISSIPTPVMGGISLLLFGLIATSGIRLLVDERHRLQPQPKPHPRERRACDRRRHGGRRVRDSARQVHGPGHGAGRSGRRRPEPHPAQGERGARHRVT